MTRRWVPGPQRRRIHAGLVRHFDETELALMLLNLEEQYHRYSSRNYDATVLDVVEAANRNGWLVRLLGLAAQERPGPRFPFQGLLRELTETSRDHLMVLVAACRPDGAPIADTARRRLADLAVTLRPCPGGDGDEARAVVDGSDVVVLVMTTSGDTDNWLYRYALDRADTIGSDVVVLLSGSARAGDLPPRVFAIPVTDDADRGWARLDAHLDFLASPERLLHVLRTRLDWLTGLLGRSGVTRTRVETEIRDTQVRMAAQQRRAEDPIGARRAFDDGIERGLTLAKQPGGGKQRSARVATVNEPPPEPPAFLDRDDTLVLVERYLSDQAIRLIALTGRDGIGKTGFVSRLWNRLVDDAATTAVDGLVYLPVQGFLPVTATALLRGLFGVAPTDDLARLEERVRLPIPLPDKADEMLAALGGRTVVVMLDNAEDLLDGRGDLHDADLAVLVRHLVRHPNPAVRLVLISQRPPTLLVQDLPAAAVRGEPLVGLDRDETHSLLCALDTERRFDFELVSDQEKDWLHHLTGGTPRALELAYAVLRARPEKSLTWLLGRMRDRTVPDVVVFLLGEVFGQLARDQRPVVEALAAYGGPIDAAAVDDVLQRYVDATASEPILESLHARRLVRRDGDRFYLPYHPDGKWVLDHLPPGGPHDRVPAPRNLTRLALLYLCAEHFRAARKPNDVVTGVDDLDAHFNEINLRIRGGEYTRAQDLIERLDDRFLHPWGYSDSVVPMLKKLATVLAGDRLREARRLSRLSEAYRQRECLKPAIDAATGAMRLIPRHRHGAYHAAFNDQVGAALLDLGQIRAAATRYRRALYWSTVWPEPYEAAKAHGGLLLCNGRSGRFGAALWHHNCAVRLLRRSRVGDPDWVRTRAALNAAWVHSQLGRHGPAWRALEAAFADTVDERHRLLEGQALVLRAQLLIDEGDLPAAIAASGAAAEIATQADAGWLCRAAREIVTIASLCQNDLERAGEAVDVPGRSNGGVLGIGLRGIVAYRRNEPAEARRAFTVADEWASPRRLADERDFQLLDWHGVVLTGLAVIDPERREDRLYAAEDKFRRARSIAPGAHGAVLRTMQLLNQLAVGADPALITRVRRAVGGFGGRL